MRAWTLAALCAATLGAGAGTAQNAQSGFGLGIVLGNPSGISAKIPGGAKNSINLIVGYDLDPGPGPDCCDGGSLYAGGDYVWYNYNLINTSGAGRLPVYYGPGLNATVWDGGSRVGFRIALGLEYQFATAPMDVFFEIAPGVNVIPDTRGYVSAGLGMRFFF